MLLAVAFLCNFALRQLERLRRLAWRKRSILQMKPTARFAANALLSLSHIALLLLALLRGFTLVRKVHFDYLGLAPALCCAGSAT